MFEIPIWEKYALSIEEAADYFGIGQKKIRKIVDENPTAEFVLKNGAFTKNQTRKIRKVPGPDELHLEGSEHL